MHLGRVQHPNTVRPKLPGPFDRVTMGLATQMALYEEMFKVRFRLMLSDVVAELLWWY